MNDTSWDEFQPEQARLRALVGNVESEIAVAFSRGVATDAPRLADAWQRLVAGLDLGAAPALRRCPFCARQVLNAATRCRYCMKTSDAGKPDDAAPPSRR
jgi:hypothetical protein